MKKSFEYKAKLLRDTKADEKSKFWTMQKLLCN